MLRDRLHYNRQTLTSLVKVAVPMVVSQGAFAVMTFTDRLFLSQITPTHMAAALGGGIATFFSICFFTSLLSYGNALSAQYLGAGEKEKCARVVVQGLIIGAACLPLLAVVAVGVGQLFELMGHQGEQLSLERTYYGILMLGSVFTLAKTCLAAFFAGIARTRVVMVCDLLGMTLNVPLSYVLIFGHLGLPSLGMVGAGVSTVMSGAFSLGCFAWFYLRPANRQEFSVGHSLTLEPGILRRYLRLGIPSGVELFLNVATFNLFLLMFQSYGVTEGAAVAIVFNWDILSYVPLIGVNIGVMSLIGRSVGARDMTQASQVISAGFMLAIPYAGLMGAIFILLRSPLVDVFAPPAGDFDDIRILAEFMMIGMASYTLVDAVILVSGGVLRGAGDTRWVMFASTSLHWCMLVAEFLIIKVYELGPRIAWLAFVAMLFAIAIVFVLRLAGGRWRDPERLRLVMAE